MINKKILLRERKRHTTRHVVALSPGGEHHHPVTIVGSTPIQSWLGGGVHIQSWWGVPPSSLNGGYSHPVPIEAGTPIQAWQEVSPSSPNRGYPPSPNGGPPSSLDRVYPSNPDERGTPIQSQQVGTPSQVRTEGYPTNWCTLLYPWSWPGMGYPHPGPEMGYPPPRPLPEIWGPPPPPPPHHRQDGVLPPPSKCGLTHKVKILPFPDPSDADGNYTCDGITDWLQGADKMYAESARTAKIFQEAKQKGHMNLIMNPDTSEALETTYDRTANIKPYLLGSFGSAWGSMKVRKSLGKFRGGSSPSPRRGRQSLGGRLPNILIIISEKPYEIKESLVCRGRAPRAPS